MSVTITERTIKSKTKSGDTTIIIENIKYPYFESDSHAKLCKKMNSFYEDIAKKYSDHAKNKLAKKIKTDPSRFRLPVIIRMNYTTVIWREKIISVVIDLSFVRGDRTKERRFSQLWSIGEEDMLPVSEILKTDRKSRKVILSLIAPKAEENGKNSAFGYFPDYSTRLSRHFSLCNCFIAPNGLCFFINAGVLSPIKYGACNFVLSFSDLENVAKGSVLSENVEKTPENSDIVNNI